MGNVRDLGWVHNSRHFFFYPQRISAEE